MDEYIGFGCRDLTAENHWREIETPSALTGGKKILIFPGDGTEESGQANGMCKAVSKIFTNKKNLPEIYSIYYKNNGSCATHRNEQKAAYNQLDDRLYPLGKKSAPYLETFYQQQILPLISDGTGRHRLSEKEAAQNLRDLTIITHCHGSVVLLEIENKLKHSMCELGYGAKERQHILRQLFSLNICSAMPLEQTETTALHVISQSDSKAVVNWRLGSMNRFLQTSVLRNKPAAVVSLSPHEEVFALRNIYTAEADEIDGSSPDEHLGSLYFDFSINPDLRTEESDVALKTIHHTIHTAMDTLVPLLPLTELQKQKAPYPEFLKHCCKTGQDYGAKGRQQISQIQEAEAKLWSVLQSRSVYNFEGLPTVELLLRRNDAGQTPFDFIMERGNLEEINNMQQQFLADRKRRGRSILPARLLSRAMEKAVAAKRFDIVDCFVEKNTNGLPPFLSVDKLEAEDIPVVMPILKKINLSSQSLYSLLPLYIKSDAITNPLQRKEAQRELRNMLFSEKTSLRESIKLYQYCSRYQDKCGQELRQLYNEQISSKTKTAKDFYDIHELEVSRQAQGEKHQLYENLSMPARLKIEQICHQAMKKHLKEYVKAAVQRGSRSDYNQLNILFSRSMTKEQQTAFEEKITTLSQSFKENPSREKALIAEFTDYVKAANQNVFKPQQQIPTKLVIKGREMNA